MVLTFGFFKGLNIRFPALQEPVHRHALYCTFFMLCRLCVMLHRRGLMLNFIKEL